MDATRSFTYKRYMRDGSTEERNGTTAQPQRIRTGKTQRDKSKRSHKGES